MLEVTNKWNVPQELVKAAMNDDHVTKGDISVTTLIDAPQVRILKRNNIYKEDVSDKMFALIGTAFHSLAEEGAHTYRGYNTLKKAFKVLKGAGLDDVAKQVRDAVKTLYPDEVVDKDVILERTLSLSVDGINDITKNPYTYVISGTQDYYKKSEKLLKDYKSTSLSKGDKIQESWENQLNIYAYMLRQNGDEVERIQVVAYFRDFNQIAAKYGSDRQKKTGLVSPKSIVRTYDIRVWSDAECLEYIKKRVHLHYMAEQGVVPECTHKEMWSANDIYAVCASNMERSVKNHHSLKEAEKFIKETDKNLENPFIEFRPATRLRCSFFCPVAHVCPQYIKHKEFIKQLK